jgi:hypothetical protein
MKTFILNKEDFIEEKELTYIHVYNKTWLDSYKDFIELAIRYFNEQYNWDKMFNINDVEERIQNGDNLFLLYYGNQIIGYIFYKKIDDMTCLAYNLYVTKIIKRPENAAYWFYNRTSGHMLKYYQKIECVAEDWNNKVHDIFYKTGFKEI